MKKIKMSMVGLLIFTSIVFLLNFLLIFLFIVYFYLDKGNVVAILFGEKIIILDIAIICAIGKTQNWSVFKYLSNFKFFSNSQTSFNKDKKQKKHQEINNNYKK